MKMDLSFMDLYLGIGKHRDKTWREVENIDPNYVNWAKYNATNKDWVDFAKIIERNRQRMDIDSD